MNETPTVFCCMPSSGKCDTEAAASHYALPTRGKTNIIPGHSFSSLLAKGHNDLWGAAIHYARNGIITHYLNHHADIEIRTHGWLDVMIEEMNRTGAAILSVCQPIKANVRVLGTEVSTALPTDDPWRYRKLTWDEIADLPPTFTLPNLLVNTGLLLIDVRRQEFWQKNDRGEYKFYFTINDRIIDGPDGVPVAQYQPEDYNFSAICHEAGLPVYATRVIDCLHYGRVGFSNQPAPKEKPGGIQGWFDFEDVYHEAVERTPREGAMVEVGCWKGKSLCHLLELAKKADKGIDIFGVDHFKGSIDQPELVAEAQAKDIRAECFKNVKAMNYPGGCAIVTMPSVEAAKEFKDRSLDFVFLDASHDYQSVCSDIKAWLPKVKTGGILSGHDYDETTDPGVPRAVKACLPKFEIKGRCWWHEVGG